MHSDLCLWLSRAHGEELRRAARRSGGQPEAPPPAAPGPVTLRFAFPDDAAALGRLALLDSSMPPALPVLLAEVDGELQAALSLADGRVVADPFVPTMALVELLHARARQLEPAVPRRFLRLPRPAVLRWRSAWR